ncbi:hypothetical protein ORL36_05740 [Klebsiella pasteurii]|uniref:hypothetical protein n=1 Tax=Klebsiella pasteurii TaxID=2587529 RepID=UPI00224585E8|nr:hypothetical protein [Klebsiella pasteurii]MCW9584129.1 hypothetical protein [Klebsiella pasteurii]
MFTVSITTVQRNTQQVKAGFWQVSFNGRTISNVVKLGAGRYGVTHLMQESNTFMGALSLVLPLYKELASAERKSTVKRFTIGALLVACGAVAGVAHAAESYHTETVIESVDMRACTLDARDGNQYQFEDCDDLRDMEEGDLIRIDTDSDGFTFVTDDSGNEYPVTTN